MKRRYRTSLYKEKLKKIKKAIPDVCIGNDVIVGFPEKQMNYLILAYILLRNYQYLIYMFLATQREKILWQLILMEL